MSILNKRWDELTVTESFVASTGVGIASLAVYGLLMAGGAAVLEVLDRRKQKKPETS